MEKMNKELSDRVWKMLPKEFKEEVKRLWSVEVDCATKYHSDLHKHRTGLLYELFGDNLHWQNSLTSNEEGEELLTVSRKRVQELYNALQSVQERKDLELHNQVSAEDRAAMIFDLFGSKCLPDELNEDNFAKSEPKPAEPKFKEGDRAIYCIPEKQRINARVVNVRQRSGSTLFNTLFNYDIRLDDGRTANWVDEQWLLPDNDDQVRAVTKKASERFDKILAKDLRKEKRLRIATQLMAAMMSNPVMFNKSIPVEYEDIVHGSLEYADAIIEAVEKGGCQ